MTPAPSDELCLACVPKGKEWYFFVYLARREAEMLSVARRWVHDRRLSFDQVDYEALTSKLAEDQISLP